MENIVQIAVIAMSAALCAVVVKKQTPEIGVILCILAGGVILFLSMPAFNGIKELMVSLADMANISPAVLTPVVKTAGISIVTKLAADICRDAKEGGIASFLETAGAALALAVCAPLIESVLSMIDSLL